MIYNVLRLIHAAGMPHTAAHSEYQVTEQGTYSVCSIRFSGMYCSEFTSDLDRSLLYMGSVTNK